MGEHNDQVIFNSWTFHTDEEHGQLKYDHEVRDEVLADLCNSFYKHVDYDTAVSYKSRVIRHLVTKDRKKWRWPDWDKRVERRFLEELAVLYVNDISQDGPLPSDGLYGKAHPDISKWVKENYGNDNEIMRQAHTVGDVYWLEFLDDKFAGRV